MSNVKAIIAYGAAWHNSPLDYSVKTDSGVEQIRFEIGDTGHPEATRFPKSDEGYEFFRSNPDFFKVIEDGDEYPTDRAFNIGMSNARYLKSLTTRAIPFLEKCLESGSVGRHRRATEEKLAMLKLQKADTDSKKKKLKEIEAEEKSTKKKAEK